MNADPSTPHLEGAAFDAVKRNTFQDQANNVRVTVLEDVSGSYRVRLGPP